MASITINHLVKKYGDGFPAVNDVSIDIADGEFMILVGPSGCGKSTLLRMIVGLEDITDGDLLIGDRRVNDLAPRDRNLAMVFQNYALYPHLTVYENIAFPLRATRMSKGEVDQSVREIARVLRITDLLSRKPSALSGGDMQRVAIGRALVRRPKAMLMDEPIGALDAKLREEMRAEIKRLHVKQGSTTIYVTHDQIEAMSLADRIVIMHEGVLQQVGTPEEVYQRPANLFVAQFVGSPVMNVAETRVAEQGGQASVSVGGVERGFAFPHELLSKLNGHAAGGLALGIRPEGVLVRHEKADGYLPVEARIIEPLGSFDIVDLTVGDEVLRARTKSGFVPGPGKQVFSRLDPAQAHFFDTASGKSLGVKL